MNMKRQVSVSIFLAIIVIALTWLYIKFNNETSPKENVFTTENDISKEESVTISQEYITCPFYIKEEDGRLIVYESKTQQIYMETSIEMHLLPEELIEKLDTGIFFQTEGELYDFLESYSS